MTSNISITRKTLGYFMATGAALVLSATGALAQTAGGGGTDAGKSWDIILGAGAQSAPVYEGSDETEASPLPLFILSYGRWQFGPDRVGLDLWSDTSTYGTLNLSYGGGRSADDIDSNALDGLDDIDDGAILGGEIGYRFGATKAYLDVNRYLDGVEGTTAKIGIDYERDLSQQFSFSVGASATYANDSYMSGYFGVTPAQSASSGYAAYDASSGFQRVDVSLSARYAFSPSWFVQGTVGIGKLTGDAADSPLALDDTQSSVSVFVGYRF